MEIKYKMTVSVIATARVRVRDLGYVEHTFPIISIRVRVGVKVRVRVRVRVRVKKVRVKIRVRIKVRVGSGSGSGLGLGLWLWFGYWEYGLFQSFSIIRIFSSNVMSFWNLF